MGTEEECDCGDCPGCGYNAHWCICDIGPEDEENEDGQA
jgi:hypothetical protein